MNKKPIKSDLKRLDAMRDKDIDYSEIPEFDDEFLRSVEMKISPGKKPVALRLDADVLEWMKSQGKGYHRLDPEHHPQQGEKLQSRREALEQGRDETEETPAGIS